MGVIICSFNLNIKPKTSHGDVTELHAFDFVVKGALFVSDPV